MRYCFEFVDIPRYDALGLNERGCMKNLSIRAIFVSVLLGLGVQAFQPSEAQAGILMGYVELVGGAILLLIPDKKLDTQIRHQAEGRAAAWFLGAGVPGGVLTAFGAWYVGVPLILLDSKDKLQSSEMDEALAARLPEIDSREAIHRLSVAIAKKGVLLLDSPKKGGEVRFTHDELAEIFSGVSLSPEGFEEIDSIFQ